MNRAMVTGAAHGLGLAFVRKLLETGWHVTCIDRDANALRQLALDHDAACLNTVECDLGNLERLDRTLEGLCGQRFDLVILNAAASATGRFEAISAQAVRSLVDLNTIAPMQIASRLAGSGSLERGSILLFIASLSCFTGYPGAAAYAATKDAIAGYARSIRRPFARRGISVSCAFPGPLATAQAARHAPKGADPRKRMDPADAADRILAAALAGKPVIIPGNASRLFALTGRLFPGLASRAMRRLIYERLDREVW